MAEPIKISTSKYTKEGKVDIDGNVWSLKLPGAGTELRFNQAKRRLSFLDKKIEAGEATEEDLDRYDELENSMYVYFSDILSDGTPDNTSVREWIDKTPTPIIMAVFEDMKEQANGTKKETQSS